VENISFNGKNIAVIGENRETTILYPSNSINPVVDFDGGAYGEMSASLLSNFTISGGGYSPESNYGTLRIVYGPSPRIEECVFVNNYKVLRIDGAAPTFSNNLFYNNDMLIDWGPNSSPENYNTRFNKCTFVNNLEFGDSENQINPVFIENSIIDSISTISLAGNYVVTFSNIDGGYAGDGNIDVDPVFVDTANGNYHLLASSQLINAGHPDSTDSDGSRADIGAYPYLNSYSGPTWFVSTSGNDTTATGASGDPFRSIQAGINFSSDTDSVTVAAGTYVENINFSGKNIVVQGEDRETTIIDGNQSGSVVTFESGEDSSTVLSGFKITNGSGQYDLGSTYDVGVLCGGGLAIVISSPTIKNLIIEENMSDYGAGTFIEGSNSKFYNTTFIGNSSTGTGGAIENRGNEIQLINCLISQNTSGSEGVIQNYGGHVKLFNCTITNNSSSDNGGAVSISYSNDVELFNSIIYSNSTNSFFIYADEEAGNQQLSVSYSNIEGGLDGIANAEYATINWNIGNIDFYPVFVDAANDDYRLADWSPCIGAGLDTSIVDTTDIDGNPRPNPAGSNPDMGAYENVLANPRYLLAVDSVYFVHGDTAIVPIRNQLDYPELNSIGLKITGFQDKLFVGLVTDSTTIFGSLGWITEYNSTDTLLITASAGSNPLESSGVLFALKLAVPDTLSSQFIPITITEFTGNEEYTDFLVTPGGVQVVWEPLVGFTSTEPTGSYPMEVTFTDTSHAGTYPINEWAWDLGNDSTASEPVVTHTYNYPGVYDVTLRIEDEFGLADSLTSVGLVQIDTLYGDVSWNALVQHYDASLILQDLVYLRCYFDPAVRGWHY